MSPFYVVTDCEFDGPTPGVNSMLSFGSVAVAADGAIIGEFEAVLAPLDGAGRDDVTMAFWARHSQAWAAATENPEPPSAVMRRFVDWIGTIAGEPIFASHPLALDGPWFDYYLRRFIGRPLLEGPWVQSRIFKHAPLCLCPSSPARRGVGNGNAMSSAIRPNGWARSRIRIARSTTPAATPTCCASSPVELIATGK